MGIKFYTLSFCLLLLLCMSGISQETQKASGKLSKETAALSSKAVDKGIRFLRNAQTKEGHWGDPGITAIAITAILKSPRKYGPEDGPWVRRPLEYLAACQKPDGGIYTDQLSNYVTCAALLAFTAHPEVEKQYKTVIEKAKKFVIDLQCDEGEGYTPEKDRFYGGFGYGSSERPDLSNTQFAIEALRSAGLPPDDPALKKAIQFLQRCQNRSESNDQEWAGNDGGFVYYPGNSAAGTMQLPNGKTGHRSYGSMTYAGIKSYIYANLTPDDPRVKAAYEWIKQNYDLSQNPGAGDQGLFYYYHLFGKTLHLLAENISKEDAWAGKEWKEDLAQALLARQQPDGSWKNANPRWWESEPRLVTAYAVMALSFCLEQK